MDSAQRSGPLRIVLSLESETEAGGTVILSDGSKVFWAEGRGSGEYVQVHYASGAWEELRASDHADHPIMMLMNEGDYQPARNMTSLEEHEWTLVRNGVKF